MKSVKEELAKAKLELAGAAEGERDPSLASTDGGDPKVSGAPVTGAQLDQLCDEFFGQTGKPVKWRLKPDS